MKIIAKIIVIIEILVVISIVVIGVMSLQMGARAIEERTEAQLESVVILKEHQLNEFVGEEVEDIEAIATEKFFMDDFIKMLEARFANEPEGMIHHETIKNLLKKKLNSDGDFFEFFILDLDGKIHMSTDEKQEGKIKSDENYFIEGKKGTFVQSFYYYLSLKQSAMTVSTPITDDEENVIGILAGRINLEEISEIMMERSGLGETGETYLVNDFNFAVTQLRGNETVSFEKAIYTEVVAACLKEKSPNVQFMSGYLNYVGEEVMGAYAYLPELKVCLIAEVGQEEAFEPITRFGNELIFISSITIIAALILGYFISKMITKPITTLRDAARKISEGDLNAKIEVKSKDEVGELAYAFKQMTKNLKKHQENLEKLIVERTKELNKKIDELERYKKLTVDRELKMIELKKENKKLKYELKEKR